MFPAVNYPERNEILILLSWDGLTDMGSITAVIDYNRNRLRIHCNCNCNRNHESWKQSDRNCNRNQKM